MANPCSTAARRLIGPPAAKAHDMKAVAHAHGSPSVLLRVCLRSNLRREPGRWPGVSPRLAGKASSVSPIPARIALQGGERAGADAIYPCPSQEKSNSWDLLGRQTAPGTGISSGNFSLTGLSLPLRCQDTRTEAFLRNLLTIARNRGGVNAFSPTLLFFPILVDALQLPGAPIHHKSGDVPVAQLVAGAGGN